jgi:hypothetical protein
MDLKGYWEKFQKNFPKNLDFFILVCYFVFQKISGGDVKTGGQKHELKNENLINCGYYRDFAHLDHRDFAF